jgi:hypothetical protein
VNKADIARFRGASGDVINHPHAPKIAQYPPSTFLVTKARILRDLIQREVNPALLGVLDERENLHALVRHLVCLACHCRPPMP